MVNYCIRNRKNASLSVQNCRFCLAAQITLFAPVPILCVIERAEQFNLYVFHVRFVKVSGQSSYGHVSIWAR